MVAALVGRGIGASRTPQMHEAEGERRGFRYSYRLLDFDRIELADADLPAVVTLAGRIGLAGLNVTHPFKEAVVECLDTLSPEAEAIGAVNTVVFSGGRSTGHNTDAFGFAESFRSGLPGASLKNVLLIGAGGGGMAVGHALLSLGAASLQICDIDPAKALVLAGRLRKAFPKAAISVAADLAGAARSASGIVNATPLGMAKYPGSPIPATLLRADQWVADIVYFPADTELLKSARERGCRTLGGNGMAIFQAVAAFGLITGIKADPDHMARHFGRSGDLVTRESAFDIN
jgi:shikimate dehydrogenase